MFLLHIGEDLRHSHPPRAIFSVPSSQEQLPLLALLVSSFVELFEVPEKVIHPYVGQNPADAVTATNSDACGTVSGKASTRALPALGSRGRRAPPALGQLGPHQNVDTVPAGACLARAANFIRFRPGKDGGPEKIYTQSEMSATARFVRGNEHDW